MSFKVKMYILAEVLVLMQKLVTISALFYIEDPVSDASHLC